MNSNKTALPVVVVGGGISGLAAAHRLAQLQPARPVYLLEASNRVGGLLQTRNERGFHWEAGAEGFHGETAGVKSLCREIGIADEIVSAAAWQSLPQVVRRGTLVPFPFDMMSGTPPRAQAVVASPLFSWLGKLRIYAERWVRRGDWDDETCESFFMRRFGKEFYFRLAEPVLGAIYSADPATLSMQALLPHLRAMEQQFGNMTAAFRNRRRQAASADDLSKTESNGAWTLRGGLSRLVEALAAELPPNTIKYSAAVHRIWCDGEGGWRIRYGQSETLRAAGVVLATPAHQAARLLTSVNLDASRLLQHIAYSSVAIIALGYQREQILRPITSLGFFVPSTEPFELRSVSFTSLKYPDRAPEGAILVRASLGGDRHALVIGQDDDDLIALVHEELSRLFKIEGRPILASAQRQMFALPQYRPGHQQQIDAVRTILADFPGLALAGNAYMGIGIPHCIESGQQAAEQISRFINETSSNAVNRPTAPSIVARRSEATNV
jgi:oxygen-dependent protoporphyrinogen oxidase